MMMSMMMSTTKKLKKRDRSSRLRKNQRKKLQQRKHSKRVSSQHSTNSLGVLEAAQDIEIKAIEDVIGAKKFTRDQILSYLANAKNEKDPRTVVIK